MKTTSLLLTLVAAFSLLSPKDAGALGSSQENETGNKAMSFSPGVSLTMRSTIEKRAYRIIHEIAAVDYSEIKPEASFVDDLGMDDLDFIEMIMAVEKEFGLEIPDEDAEKFKTVGDLIKYLKEKVE